MLKFSLLGSGSAGNAMLVVSPTSKILIDCGLSYRQLVLRSKEVGESLEGLDAVFVTHERRACRSQRACVK
ncbi:MAG: MBL fold metallo-hydrolase [Bacteroidetes bacterium]|nr:MBL fold metallo-hydrolase [Bacteroidota bacterium]